MPKNQSMSSPGSNEYSSPDLDAIDIVTVLQALSDPVRLEIVRQLAACRRSKDDLPEMTCGQLSIPVTKSTATHHIKTLFSAGLIAERDEGTRKHFSLRKDELDARFPGLLDSVIEAS